MNGSASSEKCTVQTVAHNPILGSYSRLDRVTNSGTPSIPLGDNKIRPKLSKVENSLVKMAASYQDIVFCQRTPLTERTIQRSYCLHILRHIAQAKKTIRANDKVLEAAKQKGNVNALKTAGGFNDHGFHRCRVLILLPTRHFCVQVVEALQSLLQSTKGVSKATIGNQHRFYEEFGEARQEQQALQEDEYEMGRGPKEMTEKELLKARAEEHEESSSSSEAEDNEAEKNQAPPQKRRKLEKKKVRTTPKDTSKIPQSTSRKPLDYQAWFRGNTHDNFRLGVCLSKRNVALYTPFDESDIVIASPLGLKFILDGHDDALKNLHFLSSVEVLVLDAVELLLMQNWHYVIQVLQAVNLMPAKIQLKCPLWRVKSHLLKGEASLHRQLLAFSAVEHPWISHLVTLFATNTKAPLCYFPFSWKAGRKLVQATVKSQTASASLALHPMDANPYQPELLKGHRPAIKVKFVPVLLSPQERTLGLGEQILALSQSRLDTFETRVLTRLTKGSHPGVLIYVPSYFDLVKVRHLLGKHSLDFISVTEYTAEDEVDRRLTQFQQGRARILLLSERFHFYTRRRRIAGVRNLIFYSPPTFPQFWHDFVDMIQMGGSDLPAGEQFLYLLYCAALEAPQLNAFLGVDFLRRLAWEPLEQKIEKPKK